MITLRLDKNGGINKGDIKAFEHDNLSEVYIIQLYKNGAIYDLTNKSIELTMVERKRKIGDMVSLPIYNATDGKVKLEVVSDITKQDGIYDFKLTVKDTTGLIETFPSFQVEIKNDITDSITGEIIQDPNFTILTEGLKALADYNIYKTNALKVPEIEQDIVEINEQLDTIAINVDYYRFLVENDIWTKAIRKAIEKAGVGGSIIFSPNKTYKINGQIEMLENQTIYGNNATLFRCNESITELAEQVDYTSDTLILTSVPQDWEVGDTIHIFVGESANETSTYRKIKSISGNTVRLEQYIGKMVGSDEATVYPIGAKVRKVYIMIASQQYPIPYKLKVYNLTFDGNKDNNSSNYYWNLNAALHLYGYGSIVENCKFINIPNECIVTSGSKIVNNYGENLNGSFVHLSSPPKSLGEGCQGTFIDNNYVMLSNIIDPTITGHSVAVIELSWNGGRTFVTNNFFVGNKKGMCFDIYIYSNPSSETAHYDDFVISNNIFISYEKIYDNWGGLGTHKVNNKIICNNIFKDCGANDIGTLNKSNIIFSNNAFTNGTTITGNGMCNLMKNNIDISSDTGNASLTLSANTDNNINPFVISHLKNGSVYCQKGTKQYWYIENDIMTINGDSKIIHPLLGRMSIKDFQVFISNPTTATLSKQTVNTVYANLPIGSEVYFPNNTIPIIYKKVDSTEWVKIAIDKLT